MPQDYSLPPVDRDHEPRSFLPRRMREGDLVLTGAHSDSTLGSDSADWFAVHLDVCRGDGANQDIAEAPAIGPLSQLRPELGLACRRENDRGPFLVTPAPYRQQVEPVLVGGLDRAWSATPERLVEVDRCAPGR
mgnify:CR=1 FL=1